ncbi:MAG: ATP-binding cassette domain-containing protein [Chloroflexi bacterium]|nr:ATP-binding cassette domain-containing protein [Chloroflexota bacterium]
MIDVEHLTKKFGSFTAVDDLTIDVPAGEVFGLLGPNGAGKTTTIKMLITLLEPTSGRATVAGLDVVRNAGDVRREIGYVPQILSADGTLTGYENLMVFAKLYDVPRAERNQRVDEALEYMGLKESAKSMVRNYSGGMIRRLEIAQAFVHHPHVLFLDEPTVGLDPVARQVVWERIDRLRHDYGTTIFVTTHYMEEADRLCNRVAVMNLGKVAVIGTPAELKASLGEPDATLDDVFVHYTGENLDIGGNWRETQRVRRTAQRLG